MFRNKNDKVLTSIRFGSISSLLHNVFDEFRGSIWFDFQFQLVILNGQLQPTNSVCWIRLDFHFLSIFLSVPLQPLNYVYWIWFDVYYRSVFLSVQLKPDSVYWIWFHFRSVSLNVSLRPTNSFGAIWLLTRGQTK